MKDEEVDVRLVAFEAMLKSKVTHFIAVMSACISLWMMSEFGIDFKHNKSDANLAAFFLFFSPFVIYCLSYRLFLRSEIARSVNKRKIDKPSNRQKFSFVNQQVSVDLPELVDVDEPNRMNRMSSICVADENGPMEVGKVIEHGAKFDAKGVNDGAALICAAESGNLESLEYLVKAGVNPDVESVNYERPLVLAARNGHAACVSFLIQADVELDYKVRVNGLTALMAAVINNHADVVRVLVMGGADVNGCDKERRTPLMRAVMSGDVDCVCAIIDAGAELDAIDSNGLTALSHAAGAGNLECVCVLIKSGASLDAAGESEVESEVYRGIPWRGGDYTEGGVTPLLNAVSHGRIDCLCALIKAGANVSADNDVALLSSIKHGFVDCMETLIEVVLMLIVFMV